MTVNKQIVKIIALVIIVSLGISLYNSSVNRHSHFISGYGFVWHAHSTQNPKNDGGSQSNHSHSTAEIQFLNIVTNPIFLLSAIFLLIVTLTVFRNLNQAIKNQPGIQSACQIILSLRAPPLVNC